MRPRNLIAFLIGLIGGLACLTLGLFGLYRDWQFSGPVERVSGTLDGRTSGNVVLYHFSDKSGINHGADTPVRHKTWRALQAGDAITVKYVAGHPELSRIDGYGEDTWWWKNASIGVSSGILVIGLALFLVRPR